MQEISREAQPVRVSQCVTFLPGSVVGRVAVSR